MDLPLLHPITPTWRRRNDERIAQLRPELQPLARAHVEACWLDGLPVVLMPPVRTDADQLGLYAQGRSYRDAAGVVIPLTQVGGVWQVDDPAEIVTNALTSDETPHGVRIRAAYDIALLVDGQLVSPKRGANNDSWDEHDGAFERAIEIGRLVGLDVGADWRTKAFPRGDRPHFQLKNWRALPRLSE